MLQNRYLARWLGACIVVVLMVCCMTDLAWAQPPVDLPDATLVRDSKAEELLDGRLAKFIEQFKYIAIVGTLLLCGFGLPLPEEVPILTSAVLAKLGMLDPWWSLGALIIGVMLGDSVMFMLGKHWGSHVLEHRFAERMLTPERREKIGFYFAKYGAWIIFAARFMPGLRAPLFLTSGTMGVTFWVFFFMDGAAMLISVPTSFGLAYYFTDKLERVLEFKEQAQIFAFAALVLFVVGSLLVKKWLLGRSKVHEPQSSAVK